MGFSKWLIKNGPGSIGSTANFYSKNYLLAISNGVLDRDEIVFALTIQFQKEQKFFGNQNLSNPKDIVNDSQGCLALLIFCFICEDIKQAKATSNQENFDNVTDVIYECVEVKAPEAITLS